jgi:glutathione peroxidase
LDFGPLLDKHQNLRILAFPCNQFGLQEPADDHEILNGNFDSKFFFKLLYNYLVNSHLGIRYVRPGNNFQLPQNVQMFSKIDVNGEKQNPLYEYLKDACPQTVLDLGKREQMFWNPIKANLFYLFISSTTI